MLAGAMLAGAVLGVALAACRGDGLLPGRSVDTAARLVAVGFDELPGWHDGTQHEAVAPLWRSCSKFAGKQAEEGFGPVYLRTEAGSIARWQEICAALTAEAPQTAADGRAFLERHFMPYLVESTDGAQGRFTGYYEIELEAARQADERYRYPVYAPPPDLVAQDTTDPASGTRQRRYGRLSGGEHVPFHTRAEIETTRVARDWPVLYYARDPVDLFFLHIQGSGRLRLRDGSTARIGYAADNGRGFVAIGRLLRECDLITADEASAQGIRAWMRENPEQATELMRENPRYIFFRRIEGPGPIGAAGVPLTPGRSLAVDARYIPLGAPVWLDTTMPGSPDQPLRRLVIAQDRGGDILGPVRGDLFWGTGAEALEPAGRMNQRGRYFILLPRPATS